jgi:hypothetical protein
MALRRLRGPRPVQGDERYRELPRGSLQGSAEFPVQPLESQHLDMVK